LGEKLVTYELWTFREGFNPRSSFGEPLGRWHNSVVTTVGHSSGGPLAGVLEERGSLKDSPPGGTAASSPSKVQRPEKNFFRRLMGKHSYFYYLLYISPIRRGGTCCDHHYPRRRGTPYLIEGGGR